MSIINYRKLISFFWAFIMIVSCAPMQVFVSAATVTLVNTLEAEDTRKTSVKLVGEYTSSKDTVITEYGFEYSENTTSGKKNVKSIPIASGVKITSTTSKQQHYSCTINELKENTSYVYRAYIKTTSKSKPQYGKDLTFKTVETKPQINITKTSVSSDCRIFAKGSIKSVATDGIVEYGFAYGTTPDTLEKCPYEKSGDAALIRSTNGTKVSDFSPYIEGLKPGTEYYIRAYASKSDGTMAYSSTSQKLQTKNYAESLSIDTEHIKSTNTKSEDGAKTYSFNYQYDNKKASNAGASISKVTLILINGNNTKDEYEMKRQGRSGSYYYNYSKLLKGNTTYTWYIVVETSSGTEYQSGKQTFTTDYIKASGLTIGVDKYYGGIGLYSTRLLKAKLQPQNTDEGIQWTSSNENVARVYKDGSDYRVEGVGEGTTVLTCSSTSGAVSEQFEIKVKGTSDWGEGPKLSSVSSTDTTATFSWSRPSCFSKEDKVAYKVRVYKDGIELAEKQAVTTNQSITISGLYEETKYDFRVFGYVPDNKDTREDYTDYMLVSVITKEKESKKKEDKGTGNIGGTVVIDAEEPGGGSVAIDAEDPGGGSVVIDAEGGSVNPAVKPVVTGLESSYNVIVGENLTLSFTVTDPAGGKVEKVTVKNNTNAGEVLGTFNGNGTSSLNCGLSVSFGVEGAYNLIIYSRTENYTITENTIATATIVVARAECKHNEYDDIYKRTEYSGNISLEKNIMEPNFTIGSVKSVAKLCKQIYQ